MSLSEVQIKRLLEWFMNSSETKKRWSEHRKKEFEKNHQWIQPEIIRNMSDEELEKKFIEYYRSGGGRQTLNQLYRDRIIRDKKQFRKIILYLLDESINIEERIDQVLEGKYHIEGFGKAIATSFLMDSIPDKYCLWNDKTEQGFSVIGWETYENKDSYGNAYIKVLKSLQKLRELSPELNLSFADVDLFLHTISAEDEGKKAVKAIVGDSINYWVFQGNSKVYKVVEALRDKVVKRWWIHAHKGKIKVGDKVILWVTGSNAGCYALCSVTSNLFITSDDPEERKYYRDKKYLDISRKARGDKVEIIIDYNLWNKPILKEVIQNNTIFKDFRGGNQGTNFTATKEQYEFFLEIAKETTKISKAKKYWVYAPGENASEWEDVYNAGIMAIGWDKLGDLQNYKNRDEITLKLKELYGYKNPTNDSLACWEFCNEVQVGDVIIPKKGRNSYLGFGIVETNYKFDNSRSYFKHTRGVKWLKKGEWKEDKGPIVVKTLTDITKYPEYVNRLKELIEIEKEPGPKEVSNRLALNQILYGPPGTGKTYKTVNYALAIIENKSLEEIESEEKLLGRDNLLKRFQKYKDNQQIEFITFHQNYSYEDFIQGLRPDVRDDSGELKFKLVNGVFKRLIDRILANKSQRGLGIEEGNPEQNYVIIIDEINRANISRVFGELSNTEKVL